MYSFASVKFAPIPQCNQDRSLSGNLCTIADQMWPPIIMMCWCVCKPWKEVDDIYSAWYFLASYTQTFRGKRPIRLIWSWSVLALAMERTDSRLQSKRNDCYINIYLQASLTDISSIRSWSGIHLFRSFISLGQEYIHIHIMAHFR